MACLVLASGAQLAIRGPGCIRVLAWIALNALVAGRVLREHPDGTELAYRLSLAGGESPVAAAVAGCFLGHALVLA